MGIGLEDRDLRSGLAMFLSRILRAYTRRGCPMRNREARRLNNLADENGVTPIILAFIAFVKRYGRRAKDPYQLFLRKLDWCVGDGYSRVARDEIRATGRNLFGIDEEATTEWILCQLEDRGLLDYVPLVADYPRWGRGIEELETPVMLVRPVQADDVA